MALTANSAGAGFKAGHFLSILETQPDVGFFEVHAENYMGEGGPPHAQLSKIRADYPLSVHGVGLSIGSADGLDDVHLQRLKRVADRYQPALVSEHLAWSTHQGQYFNDLLALPYTDETLARVVRHVDQIQNTLGREILLENPSSYIAFRNSTWDEVDFIAEVARRSGCALLLDVNNVYVSAVNQGYSPTDYIDRFPVHFVRELHVAGHTETTDQLGDRLLIDAHNGPAAGDVMTLHAQVMSKAGAVPTLIEWDNDLPDWPALYLEFDRLQAALNTVTDLLGSRHVA